MTDRKISELTNITGANLADDDEFVLVDTSADETKAITYGELKKFTGTVTADGLTVGGDISATGGDVDLDTLDLKAIAASKAVTAVDVFVYDTSKDSDGGAWRKRTQGTSWYNEALNTATRGSRREFPAVAVIVAEATKVTIYDGDDPALPMWVVFNLGAGNMVWQNSSDAITSAHASNGVVSVGKTTSSGLSVINFISDGGLLYYNNGYYSVGNIVSRNSAFGITLISSAVKIVNNAVNDVAMTVLPDAPIDPATGLPVPTIAVATAGGVSVIKDDGTVVDSSETYATHNVSFFHDGTLTYSRDNGTALRISSAYTADGFSGTNISTGNVPSVAPINQVDVLTETGGNRDFFGVNSSGVSQFLRDSSSISNSMVAYTTSDYNTGWMVGSIKGAFLSDTDDTDLVGSGELVTNGTDPIVATTGWVARANANLSVSGGDLVVTTPAAGVSRVYQAISVEVGQTYRIAWDVTFSGAGFIVALGTSVGGTQVFSTPAAVGERYFVATTTTVYFEFGCTTALASDTYTLSSVSALLSDADRSVNDNGLIVNGTVTRSPVATGADLVAYSGFSASNYLEQPYNSDLDFGTGDFCVMGWFNGATGSGEMFSRTRPDLTGSWLGVGLISNRPRVFTVVGNTVACESADAIVSGWNFMVACRRSGSLEVYVNGALKKTSAEGSRDLNNAEAVSRLSGRSNGTSVYSGSLALWRISATAPTAEQISRIYNDEKVLFQENAQATLYGSSDAVTALAHDDATDLLHVGTSAGRSVFQGLRRVSNTTTAVGTAISASNGLVVEE